MPMLFMHATTQKAMLKDNAQNSIYQSVLLDTVCLSWVEIFVSFCSCPETSQSLSATKSNLWVALTQPRDYFW